MRKQSKSKNQGNPEPDPNPNPDPDLDPNLNPNPNPNPDPDPNPNQATFPSSTTCSPPPPPSTFKRAPGWTDVRCLCDVLSDDVRWGVGWAAAAPKGSSERQTGVWLVFGRSCPG